MVIRFRHMILGVLVIGALVSMPLLTVWRHVCMRSMSLEQAQLVDSLAVARRDVERLRLSVGQLSGNARIESIARERLGLEYPASDRIDIIRVGKKVSRPLSWEFMALVRKSFSRKRG